MAETTHEFTYTFDRAFLRAAMRRDWAWKGWLITGLFAAAGVLLAWLSPDQRVAYAWSFGVGTVLIAWVCRRTFKTLINRTMEMLALHSPDHTMSFRLDDEGFAVELEKTTSRYAWGDLRRLWRYPDVWLLEIVKMQSVLFPTDAAPDEAREFIVERCRAAGVRV